MKNFGNKIYLAIVFALLVVAALLVNRLIQSSAENAQLRLLVAELEARQEKPKVVPAASNDSAEVERLRESESQLRSEIIKLRGQTAQALRAENDAKNSAAAQAQPASPFNAIFTNAMSMGFTMAKERQAQQAQARFERMKERLNLTPAQEQSLRELMLNRQDRSIELAQKAMSGGLTPEDAKAMRETSMGSEEKIKALLTPEQQAGYNELKSEEKTAQVRVLATAELAQVQSSLNLNQEQQDKVYAILYEQSLKRMNDPTSGMNPKDINPANAMSNAADLMQKQMEQKIAALETVLTPEQLESYRSQQSRQLELMKSVFKSMTPAPAAPPK